MWKPASLSLTGIVALLQVLLSLSVAQADIIYKSTAEWRFQWSTEINESPILPGFVFVLEQAAAGYFMENLEPEEVTGLLPEQHALTVSANVMDVEAVEVDKKSVFSLGLLVDLTYVGHSEIPSLATILQQVTEGKNLALAKVVRVFDSEANDFESLFTDPEDPTAEVLHILEAEPGSSSSKRTGADKGLIAACVLLSLALVGVSSVLIWAAGGFENVWIMIKGRPARAITTPYKIHTKRSGDFENGILGAAPTEDSENIPPDGMSPRRGVYRQEDDSMVYSPESQMTGFSTQTDATRAPLGIRSMRKMNRFFSPKKEDDDQRFNQIMKMPTYSN